MSKENDYYHEDGRYSSDEFSSSDTSTSSSSDNYSDNQYNNTIWEDNSNDSTNNTDNYTMGQTNYYHTPNNYGAEQGFSMSAKNSSQKPGFFVSFLGFFLTLFISISMIIAIVCFLIYNQKNNFKDTISGILRTSFYETFNQTVDDNKELSNFFKENNISVNNIVSDDDLNKFIDTVIDATLYSDSNKDFDLGTFNKSYDKWADNVIRKYCDSNLVNDIFSTYGISYTTDKVTDKNTSDNDSAKDLIVKMTGGTSVANQIKSYYSTTYGSDYIPKTVDVKDIDAIYSILTSKSHEYSATKFKDYNKQFDDYMSTVKTEDISSLSLAMFRYIMYGSAIFAIVCCVIMYLIYSQKHRFARNVGIACLITAIPIGLITTILYAMTDFTTHELSAQDLPKDAIDTIQSSLSSTGTGFLITTCLLMATFVLMLALGYALKKKERENA